MAKSYSDEFKREAMALVEDGTPARQVADDLGIRYWTLVGWLRKKREAGEESKSRPLSVEEENRQLREENRRLKLEREILKKAAAFFASEKP